MNIGFIQDADDSSEAVLGYADTSAGEDEEDGSWLLWTWRVFIDFFLVYGLIAIVRDLIDYLRAW